MDRIQEARQVITEAEQKLRKLIEEGLEDHRYDEVAVIARLAEEITLLLKNRSSITTKPHITGGSSIKQNAINRLQTTATPSRSSAKPKSSRNSKAGSNSRKYPRFERDHDRLIKIGWSKKTKKEYEHRAPKEIVIAFVQHIVSNVGVGELFEVEQILPIHDSTGTDVPAYQVYLSLAWLRDASVINKKGRDGYVLMTSDLNESAFSALWTALPVQSML